MTTFANRLVLLGAGVAITVTVLWFAPRVQALGPIARAPGQQASGVQGITASAPVIQYQGRLLDPATGQPKSDGAYAMIFHLYNVATGGTALWTETKNVSLVRGLFNTLLGDTTPLPASIFTGQDLFLGIQVGADPEATPRQRLGHVGYAFYAQNAALLNGQAATTFAPATHTHNGAQITAGLVGEPFLDPALTRDSEVMARVLISDGVNSGLDADLLDGLNATSFARSSHTHTGRDIADGSIAAADLAAELPKAKFISIDPYNVYAPDGSAWIDTAYGASSGIHLPGFQTLNATFGFGFTLPPDYTPGGAVLIDMVWNVLLNDCSVDFQARDMTVTRIGRPPLKGDTPADGVVVNDGKPLQSPGAEVAAQSLIRITTPEVGNPLQAGDTILLNLSRVSFSQADTCDGDLIVQGLLVRYE